MLVNSDSRGEPARFRSLEELESALRVLETAGTDGGRVTLVVSRREGGRRETPDRVRFTRDEGVPGDAWGRRENRKLEGQITVMQADVATLIANGQPLTLFGDNLFVELDLSVANLPIGSRVRVGGALLEVTPKPHNGCHKFRDRFGADALRFVSKPDLRARNLRGIYMHVVEDGEIACGDPVEVIARASGAPPRQTP
jgi:MOSC domain-containing protein YiiM